jgi:hypothetical protein
MPEALEVHLRRQIEHSRRFFWHRVRWRAVCQYLPENSPFELVDVGAGAGLLGTFLRRDRPRARYRFVEPIASLGNSLRQTYGDSADAGKDADYRSAAFVTLLDVLEHQEDDRSFMEQLVGKMAPGSKLVLTVPALQSLWSTWDANLGHFRRYDKSALLGCIAGLPLDVDEISYLFPEMVPLAMFRAHRRGSKADSSAGEDVEFPDLPRAVNEVLYVVGSTSFALRRHWGRGTSLLLVATVTE